VDEMLKVQVILDASLFALFFVIPTIPFLHIGFSIFYGKFAETFAATFGVFCCVHVLSAMTIFIWQYFGATITIQH